MTRLIDPDVLDVLKILNSLFLCCTHTNDKGIIRHIEQQFPPRAFYRHFHSFSSMAFKLHNVVAPLYDIRIGIDL
ncbi:hypothetical protein ES703_24785 [subsurface metagenome]